MKRVVIAVKYTVQYVILLVSSLFLSACSLDKDVADLYKKEIPLEVDIIVPDDAAPNKPETIQAVLTQGGKRVEQADFVHFEVWKKDGSIHYGMQNAGESGNGTYSVSKVFEQEGLYVIKVHASSKGSIVIPRKQFIVGKLSDEELHSITEGSQNQAGNNEQHH